MAGHVTLIVKACGEGGVNQGEAVKDQPAKAIQAAQGDKTVGAGAVECPEVP
jgi:hypothetical protein